MIAYGLASCILGWTSMSHLASASLRARGLEGALGTLLRVLIATVCVAGATASWLLVDDAIACVAFSLACACMGALLACDLREHVLPTELVGAFLVLAIVFRLSIDGLQGIVIAGLPAGLVAAALLVINRLRTHRGAGEIVGSGDLRMLVPLALFSGAAGFVTGLLACMLLMGLLAFVQLASGSVRRDTQIALAPGLAIWLFVGTLVPLLAA